MKVETQDYLDLVESANKICFLDIEASGLRGDYNSVLVASIRDFQGNCQTFTVVRPGNDQRVVREVGEILDNFLVRVTYYGRGFDLPMLNTRRLVWGLPPIPRKHHIDLYFSLKSNLNTARKSQGHLLSWLGIEHSPSKGEVDSQTMPQKMSVSAEMWNKVLSEPKKYLPVMVARCESDVEGLHALYVKTRHLLKDVTVGA